MTDLSRERIEEALAEIAAAIDLGLQAWRTSPPAAQKLRAASDATQSLAAALREAQAENERRTWPVYLREFGWMPCADSPFWCFCGEPRGPDEHHEPRCLNASRLMYEIGDVGDDRDAPTLEQLTHVAALAVSPPADEAKLTDFDSVLANVREELESLPDDAPADEAKP